MSSARRRRAAPWARAFNSQALMALFAPRPGRIASLIELRPGRSYVDIGCGTAAFAHLLARTAGLDTPPLTLDFAPGPGPVEAIAWPGALPLADASVECLTSLYFVRRLDDDSHAQNARARDLLLLLAHFAPGSPVPDVWLMRALPEGTKPRDAKAAIKRLIAVGLAERAGDDTLRMHRLVALAA